MVVSAVLPGSIAATTHTYVSSSRVRLSVVAGNRFMSALPQILRQLNFVEGTRPLGKANEVLGGHRDICLIDGELDDAFDLCLELPVGMARIMALPSSSFANRRSCIDSGVEAVISNPIDPRELSEWIEHFDQSAGFSRPSVLIIDDDPIASEMIATLLRSRGIDSEVLGDPLRTFDVFDRSSFDVVLMDLLMPGISGVDLARMIRQDRRHLSVPIVFLSSDSDTETQMTARRLGGDDFLSKRTDPVLLGRLIEVRVERARVVRALIERDGLTGLVNHRRFVERVGQELARSHRTGSPCTFAMIDLDHFKSVNDVWGHQTGDLVLRQVASSLSSWLRRTDVVGRCGGEEFGILMLDTPVHKAVPVIDAFREHFAALDIGAPGGSFRVTLSAGVADGRLAADSAALISSADAALYRAKAEGRNRVVLSEPLKLPAARRVSSVPRTRGAADHE